MNRWLIASIVLTLAAAAAPLYLFYARADLLKEQIPTHTNAQGVVDKYTPRDEILPQFLIVPGVMAGFVLLTVVLPWLSPKGYEIDRFYPTFSLLMAVVVALFGYIQALLVLGGVRGVEIDTGRFLLGGMSLFFALLGNRLGKVQRNFWMGVRTPWTLASETVWIRTHRLAAWLWTAGGLLGCVAVFAGLPVWAWIAGVLVMALTPVLYSLVLYKRLERRGAIPPPPSTPVTEDVR